ncbi:MAG TPA: glycoside hydrolase family 130 protein [Candidatus Izemoplasmatales bacterium]|nr:glycoside hydrolase family 130 protein [Candidatus Izemoplasmatales bacterium]
MSKYRILGDALPHLPWEDKPAGHPYPVWRSAKNPIVPRNPVYGVARIFNSAIVPWTDGTFIGVFRAETVATLPHLRVGRSKNGFDWEFEGHQLDMVDEAGKPWNPYYAYDPRVVKVEEDYYVIWCTEAYGPAIGLAKTRDFHHFVRLENPFIPFNRNGVLFPRKVNGMYKILSRASDNGHTPFGDIFLSESPDLVYWGRHRHVMERGGNGWWQSLKIGGGPAPIETSEGWLLLYHGVANTCSGYVYSMGAAILDLEEPSKVKYRCRNYLLTPERPYEETGFVPNVIFPCATLQDAPTGRIAIYYGAADSYVALAYTTVDELIDYIKANHEGVGRDAELGK